VQRHAVAPCVHCFSALTKCGLTSVVLSGELEMCMQVNSKVLQMGHWVLGTGLVPSRNAILQFAFALTRWHSHLGHLS
jgi:hypothetical protein